jgi:hypothetical protein
MVGVFITSVIQIYERRLNYKPYACSTTFGRATLGASVVPNKLFLAFLFSDPDVGVQFLKDVGLIQRSIVFCKWGFQIYWCFDTNREDGYRWRCRRITSLSTCSVSKSIRHDSWFQHRISWKFCSSCTTSFAHTNTIGSTWWHVKAFLKPYNRMGDYNYHLAHYTFAAVCWSDNVDQFTSPSASLQPWTVTPYLPTIVVEDLWSRSCLYVNHRRPVNRSRPVTIYNTSACGVDITTGDVAHSFEVLCAPHAAKIPNYTSERTYIHGGFFFARSITVINTTCLWTEC